MENLGKLFAYVFESRKNKNFFEVRGQANNLYIGSRAIANKEVLNSLELLLTGSGAISGWRDRSWLDKFEQSYLLWIQSSKNNSVIGLEHYRPSFSTGTTQSFDSFYIRHRHKKFKCLVGEYFYHLKSWVSNKFDWNFVYSIDDLQHNDALVISIPFCDTGSVPVNYTNLLQRCEDLNIPVLIDCCYYSISRGINLDFNYSCIDTVTFGLSKTFPVANLRIGIRYTKDSIIDGQTLHSDINYNHSFSAYIGSQIIKEYSPDFIYNKYSQQQQELCEFFGLTISNTVVFASGNSLWDTYNRSTMLKEYQLDLDPGLFNNRICLNTFYENWDLFERFKKIL